MAPQRQRHCRRHGVTVRSILWIRMDPDTRHRSVLAKAAATCLSTRQNPYETSKGYRCRRGAMCNPSHTTGSDIGKRPVEPPMYRCCEEVQNDLSTFQVIYRLARSDVKQNRVFMMSAKIYFVSLCQRSK